MFSEFTISPAQVQSGHHLSCPCHNIVDLDILARLNFITHSNIFIDFYFG